MVDLMEAMGAEVTKKGNSVTVSPGSPRHHHRRPGNSGSRPHPLCGGHRSSGRH